jgi:hypothetical protein
MPINASGAVGAALEVFGSWVTDVSPDALPENVSPDNQDLIYGPGFTGSRPAFQKIPGISFPPVGGVTPTAVYGKSFVTPAGNIKNLYLDSAGRLWVEDLTNTPGAISQLAQSIPGSLCRSITKFGREYIAISDGLHGTEVPLQYDGTYLDRYTMDGPGAPPVVTSVALPSSQMVSSGNTLTRSNDQVLCATATAHYLKVGYRAQISNVPDSNATTVNQERTSASQTASSAWSFVGSQWRSNFNPGTSALSAFVAGGFGFNIPSAATILGVVVSFGINSQSTTTGTIYQVALFNSGSQIGTAKSPATAITTTITNNSYGGAADQWGASPTPTIINSPTFAFAVSATCDSVRVFLNGPYMVQVYYTLSGSGTVATVSSIVIDAEVAPGLALVTTLQPHGLIPGIDVSIVGVEPASVSAIASAQWTAGKTTLTTVNNHKLQPGAVIQVSSVTTSTGSTSFSFNANSVTVESVPSPNQISYFQTPITATDPDVINATADTGTVYVAWPIPDNTPAPNYFSVDSCPTPTTFYIAVSYADGTWTSGTVGFQWEGTFFVTEVVDPQHFYYYQPGPNGSTSAVGTVTPFGQAAPGLHLCQVLWLTRQGAIPAPSPPVSVILNGGQYVSVTNIPYGPPNVIARILAFTGAQADVPGQLPPFFYIPFPAQLEGQVVSTSTVVNDNTTTSAFLDFSDNTLYAATGISLPGNNLANQIVLDGALGFRTYLSRLISFGQRNVIQNLLNLGFEGGWSPFYHSVQGDNLNYPLGWTANPAYWGTGILVNDHFGMAWQITLGQSTAQYGNLRQSGYLDAYGDPIFLGNQTYSIRFWAHTNGDTTFQSPTIIFELSSSSTSFVSSVIVPIANSTQGQWYEAQFSAELPDNIPSDLTFQFWGGGVSLSGAGTITIDDIQPIFAQTPYLENKSYASYVNNPEGIDGDTGQWGPVDTAKIMDMGIVRGTLCIVTQAPSGKLHETTGSAVTEPSGWEVEPIAGSCGALSAFGLTVSQADDATEAGGEDWMAWASDVGAVIYGGGLPEKISQEIQPNWNYPATPNASIQINMAAATTAWALNDPVSRLLMFGLPIGAATAPSQIYVLDYQHLGNSQAIASSPPFHPSFSGKLIATDNSRKWTHWISTMNGAARMYRSPGSLTTCFFGGNGQAPGLASGYGNVYTLNPAMTIDDDYGQFFPYYTTYAFIDPERRQQMQLKNGRLLLAFVLAQIQAIAGDTNSQVTLEYYPDNLNNPWPLSTTRTLTANFYKDRNFGGGMAQGDRIFIKIYPSPVSGIGCSFVLTRLEAFFRNARILVIGVNQ